MLMLLSWFLLAVGVWVAALVLPGFKLRPGIGNAVIIAALFGILNVTVGLLLKFVIGVMTLGIAFFFFTTVTKAFVSAIVLVIVDKMSDALEIDSFVWALIAGLLMNLISGGGMLLLR